MVTLRFKNFQSIEDGEITVKGLTVLAGPSNSGKTAVVRAYRGVFNNSPARSLIRRGENSLEVAVEYDDGQSIVWRKGKGVNEYAINGGPPINGGQTCPDEVREVGGVSPIQSGSNTVWPQIASQEDGMLFLTHLPGSVLADAISDVERVGTLNRALKSAEKDLRSAESTLKVRRKDKDALKGEVSFFSGLSSVESLVEEIDTARDKARKIEAALNWFSGWLQSYEEADRLFRELDSLNVDVPDEASMSRIQDLWQDYLSASAERDRIRELFDDIERLERILPGIEAGIAAIDVESLSKSLDKLDKAIEKVSSVVAVIPELETLETFLNGFPDRFSDLPDLSDIESDMNTLVEYESALNALKDAKAKVTETELDFANVNEEWMKSVDEVLGLLGELEECPVCGTPHGTSESHLD